MVASQSTLSRFCTVLVLAAAAMLLTTSAVHADVTVNVEDSSAGWIGFMNVFETDQTTPAFGSGWGTADLRSTFDDPNNKLTLEAASVNGNPPGADCNGFWFVNPIEDGDCTGEAPNKYMEANLYREFTNDPVYSGQTVTFEGNVLMDNWVSGYSTRAFIRDFAPDFSSSNDMFLDLTGPGPFSLSLLTDGGADRHVQVGFQTRGNVTWVGTESAAGNMMIGIVPEPSALGLAGIGLLAFLRRRRG